MIDIDFYMKIFDLKQKLMNGKTMSREFVFSKIEECRSKIPVLYNIETTNACNMRCQMCPRTTMMTRKVETMSMEIFSRIADQIKPFSAVKMGRWESFVEKKYRIHKDDISENHFFLYVIPKVIVMHGYGDPLLDRMMPERIKILTKKKIPSYFSCNPANINIGMTDEMFKNGLGYIKYSIESVDDLRHKKIRGKASNFSESYKKILQLLELKRKHGYKTVIVITMLRLDRSGQGTEFEKLRNAFLGEDVYIYLKSQDQKWYQGVDITTRSIHWMEFCQFPWSSMTIKSDGRAVECVEDYNNEIILGDAAKESLRNIWNGENYRKLRFDHFELTRGLKCVERCDMKLIGEFFKDKTG